jgi:putative sigma-54 modulation protein
MRQELTGRHVEISPALRELVDTKLKKLERLLSDSAVSTQIVLTREKKSLHTEIVLHVRGEKFLHGVGSANLWGPSVSQAIEKLLQQARTIKGKWQDRKRDAPPAEAGAETAVEPPARAKNARKATTAAPRAPLPRSRRPRAFTTVKQTVEAMSVSDAIRRLADGGPAVVMFREGDSETVSVLYRGQDGELTLVEAES